MPKDRHAIFGDLLEVIEDTRNLAKRAVVILATLIAIGIIVWQVL